MVRKAIVGLAAIVSSAMPASGQQSFYFTGTTGTILMQVCPAIWKPGNYDPCGAYLLGMIDGLSAGRWICPSTGASNMQLEQIAFDAVKSTPERWNEPAVRLIGEKLGRLYPCRLRRK